MRTAGLLIVFLFAGALCWSQDLSFEIASWPPYIDQKQPGYGLLPEIVSAACRASDLRPSYYFFPITRAQDDVLSGKAFAAFPYLKVEGDSDFAYSEPLIVSSFRFFYYAKNPRVNPDLKFNSLAELGRYVFAQIAGYPKINAELSAAKVGVDPTPNMESAFRKLTSLRIDFVIEDQAAGTELLKRIYPDSYGDFRFLNQAYGGSSSVYFMKVSKTFKNADSLLRRFNEGLKKIQQNGDYDKILKKYGVEWAGVTSETGRR